MVQVEALLSYCGKPAHPRMYFVGLDHVKVAIVLIPRPPLTADILSRARWL